LWGIVGGPTADNTVWFTESGSNNKVAKIDTGLSTLTEYSIPSASASPTEITLGPGSAVWFAENGGSRIGTVNTTTRSLSEYATPTPSSAPAGVTAGPDGNLWLTESASAANRLGTT